MTPEVEKGKTRFAKSILVNPSKMEIGSSEEQAHCRIRDRRAPPEKTSTVEN